MDKRAVTEPAPTQTLEQLAIELAKVGDELTEKYDPHYKEQITTTAGNMIARICLEAVFFLIKDGAIWKAMEKSTEML